MSGQSKWHNIQYYNTLTYEFDLKNMPKMLEMFDDNEDVQNVWHNWENEE